MGVSGAVRNMYDMIGVPVVTDDAFLAMRHVLEIRNQEFKDRVAIINTTEAGLGVPGMENQRFGDCLERYVEPVGLCDIEHEFSGPSVNCLAKESVNNDISTFSIVISGTDRSDHCYEPEKAGVAQKNEQDERAGAEVR